MLETENGKVTRPEYKEQYLYIFKMTNKTGSSNRSSSTAHGPGGFSGAFDML